MTIDDIASIMAGYEPSLLDDGDFTCAAVALILRDGGEGPESLFIERARRDGDPWSGDLGFPGGKVEKNDGNTRLTAERETWEEVGLELRNARYLGRLSDISGAHVPVRVSCFLYGLAGRTAISLSEEVREAFWVPLAELVDPSRHQEVAVVFRGEVMSRPAILLPHESKPVLWGITYRLVMQFLELLHFDCRRDGRRAAGRSS